MQGTVSLPHSVVEAESIWHQEHMQLRWRKQMIAIHSPRVEKQDNNISRSGGCTTIPSLLEAMRPPLLHVMYSTCYGWNVQANEVSQSFSMLLCTTYSLVVIVNCSTLVQRGQLYFEPNTTAPHFTFELHSMICITVVASMRLSAHFSVTAVKLRNVLCSETMYRRTSVAPLCIMAKMFFICRPMVTCCSATSFMGKVVSTKTHLYNTCKIAEVAQFDCAAGIPVGPFVHVVVNPILPSVDRNLSRAQVVIVRRNGCGTRNATLLG